MTASCRHPARHSFDFDLEAAETFKGGAFACIYLAPYNYHRIHMPCAGEATSNVYVPGELFSVMSGVKLTAVAYKGAAANILATIQGEVQIGFLPVLAALPQLKTGRPPAA